MNKEISSRKKFQEQDKQYHFPYHHTPHFLDDGSVSRVRDLDWGFDYLACLHYAKKKIESVRPDSVLEVGCGDGAIIGSLDHKIKRRVGVDLSQRAIAFASAFFPDVEFKAQDAATLSEQFDAVIAVEVLEHISDKDVSTFLQTLADRTKRDGLIYISVPSINLPLYTKHYRHYDRDLLKGQILEAGLDAEILELRYFRSPVTFENIYKRLTNNRLWVGEFHPMRRRIWKKILKNHDKENAKTAQHVIAILRKNGG